MDFNTYYEMLKRINSGSQARIKAIHANSDLSEAGKSKQIKEIVEERELAVTKLQRSLSAEYDKSMSAINFKLDARESNHADKAKQYLNQSLIRSVNLGSYGTPEKLALDDDARIGLQVQEADRRHKEYMAFEKAKAWSRRTPEWITARIQRAAADNNVEELELLQSAIDLLPDGSEADRLSTVVAPIIERARIQALPPQHRSLLEQKENLEREMELINYSIASVNQRGEFVDPRSVNKESSATELTPYSPPSAAQGQQ